MANADLEQEAARLRAEIERHNRLYYVEAAPVISDREFDRLLKHLETLEAEHPELKTPDSPTQRVGGAPLPYFESVAHAVPMLSIDNTYSYDEVREWDARVRKGLNHGETVSYIVELKVDGVGVSLRYEHGELVQGSTRGDGDRGDLITANLRTVRNIPLRLQGAPPVLELRGEVYMTNAELSRLNTQRAIDELPPFANPRNATAGSLKLLDPRLCAQRRMLFVAHGLGQTKGFDVDSSWWEALQKLRAFGVPVSHDNARYDTIEDVIAHAHAWESRRNELDFKTDGLVVKVDNLSQRARLGSRSKSPRWEIAFKYSAEQAVTRITDITVQVGKTGKLTPVADLVPVELAGTTVKRASLHNADEIERKSVRIGDVVVIEKAGEIIPQVVRVEADARDGSERPYTFPTTCPSCGAPAVRPEGEVDVRCTNSPFQCPAQLKEWLRWFAHRDAMDIDGLGEKLINQLVDRGLVHSLADIYQLDANTLAALDRMGKKSAENLVAALDASKSRSLDRLLTGLTIRHVGTRVAEILAENFGSLEALRAASLETLQAVPGLGPIVASSVHDYFRDPENSRQIDALRAAGVHPSPFATNSAATGPLPLLGKTFVLTGVLPNRSRTETERLIKQYGGKVTGAVSKATNYVVAGAEPGSKLEKARQLGTTVLDEAGLEALIGLS